MKNIPTVAFTDDSAKAIKPLQHRGVEPFNNTFSTLLHYKWARFKWSIANVLLLALL